MIFNYNFKFNIEKINSFISQNNLKILDFGCGLGNWKISDLKSTKVKKIVFFDKDRKLIKHLKKKYNLKKVEVEFNYKKLQNKEFNLIIISSVIQYIPPAKLKNILFFLTKKKQNVYIILNDIPFLPRPIEFMLLPLFNLKRFFFVTSLLFSSQYNDLNYFLYKKKDFRIYTKKFKIRFIKNFHDLKFLRYGVIMKLK